jgi:hypothetical protein
MSKTTVTFTAEEFSKIVAGIARAGATYTKGIGRALLGALYFANCQNDAGPANELVQALRKSTKQQAIIDLLQENGNLAWTKQGKKPGFEFFNAMHTWLPEDVAELRTVCENWEDYKAIKIAKMYDAVKAVETIIKTLDAKANKGEAVIGAALRDKLVAALGSYNIAAYGEAV